MSNFIEYKDTVAFHPGYYVKEIIDELGYTQEEFAKRLGTTPKNLSLLVRGEQSLSADMAMKLSRMLGTSVSYWLGLQSAYDAVVAEIAAQEELKEEEVVLKELGYSYFRDFFNLPSLPRQIDEQVRAVRSFLGVGSLCVLRNPDMAVSFRSALAERDQACNVKANAMVQIAINVARETEAPKYDKKKFESAVEYALTQTENHDGFFPLVKEAFADAGVILVLLPNLPGSKTNGATKKIGSNVVLMINDRRMNSDTFWFTLLHEAGHILNGDFGVSLEGESGVKEEVADRFAQDALIDPEMYQRFIRDGYFSPDAIRVFARMINRDPGIVLGRLQNNGFVRHGDRRMEPLRRKYVVAPSR